MEFFTKIRILPDTSDIVIRDFDGEQKTYKAFTDANIPGRLIRQEDRNGNFLTFGYAQIDPDDQVTGDEKYVLTVVTDSMGRDVRFRYFASAVQGTGFEAKTVVDATGEKYGLLAEVSDFRREVNDPDEPRTNATPNGRTIKFDYYISTDAGGNVGDLKSITSPIVGGTPNGNDFASGKTTLFTYKKITDAQIAANPKMKRLKSNLLTITSPNEVAASGPASTVIEYYEEPANEVTFDRVKKYSLGGTNASGVKAGGDIEYTYTELSPNLDAPTSVIMNLPKLQIGVTDRNGNSTQYKYSGYGPILEKKESTRGLRSSDPTFYLQSYAFSEDKQPLHVANAEGGFTDYEYDSTSPDR
ncbi:MAG: hypothetical protein AAB403_20845, partial [Planctomycetota bacterium]